MGAADRDSSGFLYIVLPQPLLKFPPLFLVPFFCSKILKKSNFLGVHRTLSQKSVFLTVAEQPLHFSKIYKK